jgi:hypothetical protein
MPAMRAVDIQGSQAWISASATIRRVKPSGQGPIGFKR